MVWAQGRTHAEITEIWKGVKRWTGKRLRAQGNYTGKVAENLPGNEKETLGYYAIKDSFHNPELKIVSFGPN